VIATGLCQVGIMSSVRQLAFPASLDPALATIDLRNTHAQDSYGILTCGRLA
jgi:hypothetical protein